MLIYTNIEGKKEAVSKNMIVRLSRREDYIFNVPRVLTIIHLTNNEQLRSIDEMDELINHLKINKNR